MEAVDQLASAGTFRVVKEPLAFLRVLEWITIDGFSFLYLSSGAGGFKKCLEAYTEHGHPSLVGLSSPSLRSRAALAPSANRVDAPRVSASDHREDFSSYS